MSRAESEQCAILCEIYLPILLPIYLEGTYIKPIWKFIQDGKVLDLFN